MDLVKYHWINLILQLKNIFEFLKDVLKKALKNHCAKTTRVVTPNRIHELTHCIKTTPTRIRLYSWFLATIFKFN